MEPFENYQVSANQPPEEASEIVKLCRIWLIISWLAYNFINDRTGIIWCLSAGSLVLLHLHLLSTNTAQNETT